MSRTFRIATIPGDGIGQDVMPGVPGSLANRKPGDVDFLVVRENAEGKYSSVGGKMFEGMEREFVLRKSVFRSDGVDRILKYAFELTGTRARKKFAAAHDAIMRAIGPVLVKGPRTPGRVGTANTGAAGEAIAAAL